MYQFKIKVNDIVSFLSTVSSLAIQIIGWGIEKTNYPRYIKYLLSLSCVGFTIIAIFRLAF